MFSVVNDCDSITGLSGGGFTALPLQNGNVAAYLIPTAAGSYGASFSGNGNGAWSAVAAAFK